MNASVAEPSSACSSTNQLASNTTVNFSRSQKSRQSASFGVTMIGYRSTNRMAASLPSNSSHRNIQTVCM